MTQSAFDLRPSTLDPAANEAVPVIPLVLCSLRPSPMPSKRHRKKDSLPFPAETVLAHYTCSAAASHFW